MTQPIQEPSTDRALQGLAYQRDQIQRRPPPLAGAEGHAWMCLSTQPNGWESDGTLAAVDWYAVYLSDNADTYFDFEVEAGGGQFGDDIVHGLMLQSGVYTYTSYWLTGDLEVSTDPFFLLQNIKFSDSSFAYPGSNELGGSSIDFISTVPEIAIGGDDFAEVRSITLPVHKPGELASDPDITGTITASHSTPVDTYFWTIRLWIVRHSDKEWDEGNFEFPTWESGDPIPS